MRALEQPLLILRETEITELWLMDPCGPPEGVGNGLYFDGIDDNITVPDSASLDLSGSFTLSAWVNPASTFTDFRSILAKNYKYYLYASAAGFCGDGSPLGGLYDGMDITVCQPSPFPLTPGPISP
jgi:hypothetical protein